MIKTEKNFGIAALKAGMDEKTARSYRKHGKLPSELKQEHAWLTRKDLFENVWGNIKSMLEINPGLEAKTLFEDLQRRKPGKIGGISHTLFYLYQPNRRIRDPYVRCCGRGA